MSTSRIVVSHSPGEHRVAVLRGAVLVDYAIWRPGLPDGVGDVYRGRVTALMPAMAGAFVSLGHADGFLPDSEGAKFLTIGTLLPVRITRAATGGKGPRLTARDVPNIEPGSIRRGPNAVDRFMQAYPGATVETKGFDDDLEARVEALSEPLVELPGGARLSIHPTPALVAIDIDSGGQQGMLAVTNRAIAPSLAAEIRLRNLSGAIVVDIAGLPIRKRAALGPAIIEALADDPLKPRFLGFSALGLAEILRSRVYPPLHELLSGPHAAGLAALRDIVRNLDPNPRLLPALRAAPPVIEALRRDPVALVELRHRTGRDLTLRSDPGLTKNVWMLEPDNA